ncbi:MAG: hypothetical protein H0X46_01820 [Bacteroidetes bacterium]|nr:hypothetical protein [Bacteroidota bacterium]
MSIFKNIKLTFANNALKKELLSAARNNGPNKFTFDNAKTVGILFDATSTEDYEIVKRYVVYLREHMKKVKVLGFFSTKEIPVLTYSKLEYDFFSLKELNWTGKPDSVVIRNFIDEEYDLLIDLNIHDHFPLKYIAALSKARFKVGKLDEEGMDIHDLMIDSDNTKTVKYFLRQIDTYIAMLNKEESGTN